MCLRPGTESSSEQSESSGGLHQVLERICSWPKMLRYRPEFKEQCLQLVFAELGPEESRTAACGRPGPRVNVKLVTLYNWVKEEAA